MDLRATPNLVHLSDTGSSQRALHLAPAKGYRVVAVSGEVWITQAGHIEDYVLRAGDAITLETPGSAVVTPFGPADIEVIAPAAAWESLPEISGAAIELAQRRAHELRAQAIHDMVIAAAGWLRGRARRLLALLVTSSGVRRTGERRFG